LLKGDTDIGNPCKKRRSPKPNPKKIKMPSTPEELLEAAEKEAGTQAMNMLVENHLDMIMSLRDSIDVDDTELLSNAVRGNSRIDKAVKQDIMNLHSKMSRLVNEIARRIEDEKYKVSEEAIDNLKLSAQQNNKVSSLIVADKKIHTSCQSLKVTVETFCEINKMIIQKLENPQGLERNQERDLVLTNALLVYEITDFTINFISTFQLMGLDEIGKIHKDMVTTVSRLKKEQQSLRSQAEDPEVEDFLREQVMSDIKHREESIDMLEKEWDSYMENIEELQNETGLVSKKIPNLKLIRDNAKAQINTLAAVAVLQIVKHNVQAIEATVLNLEKLELASLSADRVRRLLGY